MTSFFFMKICQTFLLFNFWFRPLSSSILWMCGGRQVSLTVKLLNLFFVCSSNPEHSTFHLTKKKGGKNYVLCN